VPPLRLLQVSGVWIYPSISIPRHLIRLGESHETTLTVLFISFLYDQITAVAGMVKSSARLPLVLPGVGVENGVVASPADLVSPDARPPTVSAVYHSSSDPGLLDPFVHFRLDILQVFDSPPLSRVFFGLILFLVSTPGGFMTPLSSASPFPLHGVPDTSWGLCPFTPTARTYFGPTAGLLFPFLISVRPAAFPFPAR